MFEERIFNLKNGDKIHFDWDFTPEPRQISRKYVLCILEIKGHKFYSGVAVLSPEDYPMNQNPKTGWKISLERACQAYYRNPNTAHYYYKVIWSEIRFRLRQERLQKERLQTEKEQETNG